MTVDFHQFPKLLPELRIQIWMHAFLEPRVVEITFLEQKMFRDAPPLLSTCFESRQVTLPHYRKSTLEFLGHRIYFNYDRDILYFPDKHCEERRGPRRRDSLGNGALYDLNWDIMRFYLWCTTAPQVRHLAFVMTPTCIRDPVIPPWSSLTGPGHEIACKVALWSFRKHSGLELLGLEPDWYPSITLISKDPIVGESSTKYLEFGPVRDLKRETRLNDKPRYFCRCVSWYDNKWLSTPDPELQKVGFSPQIPGQPIEDKCSICGVSFDVDLRIATVERRHIQTSVSQKSSAFLRLLSKTRVPGFSAPTSSNCSSDKLVGLSPSTTGRRKGMSRLFSKSLNHFKRSKKAQNNAGIN